MLSYAFSFWISLVYNELNLNIDFHGLLYFDMEWKKEKKTCWVTSPNRMINILRETARKHTAVWCFGCKNGILLPQEYTRKVEINSRSCDHDQSIYKLHHLTLHYHHKKGTPKIVLQQCLASKPNPGHIHGSQSFTEARILNLMTKLSTFSSGTLKP